MQSLSPDYLAKLRFDAQPVHHYPYRYQQGEETYRTFLFLFKMHEMRVSQVRAASWLNTKLTEKDQTHVNTLRQCTTIYHPLHQEGYAKAQSGLLGFQIVTYV